MSGDLRLSRRYASSRGGGPDRARLRPAAVGSAGYAGGAIVRWFLFGNVRS